VGVASVAEGVSRNEVDGDAERLGAEITELCSYLYAAEYRLLCRIRRFDQHEYWARLGLCSCAHWLNLKCGIGMNAARERVRVARALGDLPLISAAFEQGRLSYSKVRALTRVATPANEDALLSIARHGSAWHVETLVQKYRRCERLSAVETARHAYEHRSVETRYDDDGSLTLKIRLPAETGQLVLKALDRALAEADGESEAGSHREAREAADVPAETPALRPGPVPIARRRADALIDVAESYLNTQTVSGASADRYQVLLHVSAETSRLEDGPHVSAETSRRIACDSAVVTVTENAKGEPLSIGRKSRAIPPSIRRALTLRDQGCRFPGCTRKRFVDGHHIRHWADGGETALDNLVLLCRHHHRLVHEGGFACERLDDGALVFRDRNHARLDPSPPLPGAPGKDQLERWFDRAFFEARIDSESCVARWYAGDTMDWDQALFSIVNR